MNDVIRLKDQYYILASSSLADGRTEVLKQGETFAVFDRYGDMHQVTPGPQGLYHEGTRFLSRFELSLGAQRPMLLSAKVTDDNVLVRVDLTNPDLMLDGQQPVPRGTLHLCRTRFLWQGTCHERIRVHNYGVSKFPLVLTIAMDADFADLFEVKDGMVRDRLSESDVEDGFLLDGYPRTTAQADYLDEILANGDQKLDVVLQLTADDEELVARLLGRAKETGRSDDNEAVIRHRLDLYHEQTEAVVAKYAERGILTQVDGIGAIDEVTDRVMQAIKEAQAA